MGALAQDWTDRKQLDLSPSSPYCRLGLSSQVFFWTRDPDCPEVAVGLFLASSFLGSSQFKSFVVDMFVLPVVNDLLLEGPGQKQI